MRFISIFILVLASFIARADEAVHRETVEQLLETMQIQSMIELSYGQIDKVFQEVAKNMNIRQSEKEHLDRFSAKLTKAMREHITWEKLKEPTIDIYVKHYTQKEIEDVLAFYKTESGQALLKKTPIVLKESNELSQKILLDFLPTMQALAKELQDEIQQARAEAGAIHPK